ncbi:MAG: hypothetical protein IPN68_17415 [Bacteroidetes bacterium]|nr:hypothetical protein [Bacteroidota bacterium]
MKQIFLLLAFLTPFGLYGQVPLDVAESTLKVNGMGEEIFYYGFAEGDQLIFNFREVNGKELKELEIIELPSSSKFMDYETEKVEDKIISIASTGVYKFRFKNSAIGGRVCELKIQRIPSSDATKNFNTSVFWKTIYDTTYLPTQEKYLVRSDTTVVSLVDQIAKISSQTAVNGNPNRIIVDFTLPENTVSWSYYIGVGNEGKEAYDAARTKFLNSASASVSTIPGYGTMAALALSGINYFTKAQGDDNVKYWFIRDWENVQAWKTGEAFYHYKQGDVINDASQMKSPGIGKVYLGLLNDNVIDPIDVVVKVTAITIVQQWDSRIVNKMNVTLHQVAYLKN